MSAAVAKPPVVFACAGCSFVAGLSWQLAKALDQQGIAEMSCLAGVAAQRPPFRKILDQREAWVIDGCPIDCGLGVFENLKRKPQRHIRLYELGFKKHVPPHGGVDMQKLIKQVQALVAAPCDEESAAATLQHDATLEAQ